MSVTTPPESERPAVPPGFGRAILGSGVISAGVLVSRAMAFVAVALLTRRIGADGFGVVGFGTALASYFGIAVNNGVGEIAAKEVAARPEQTSDVYGAVLTIRLTLAVLAWAILIVVASVLPLPPGDRLVIALMGLALVSASLDPGWVFKAREQPVAAALLLAVPQALYALGVFLLVPDRSAVSRVPVIQYGAELLLAVIAGGWLLSGRAPRIDWSAGVRLLSEARYITLVRLGRLLTINFDVVLLGFTAPAQQVGIYAASYRVLFLLMAIGVAIASAFLAVVARGAQANRYEYRRATAASFTTALSVGVPLSLGGVAVAPEMLSLLFGREFVSGAPAFRLLLLAGGCHITYTSLTYAFVAAERTRFLSLVNGVAAALNVAINLWAIPRYGITAAAAATLTAEGFTAVVMITAIARDPGLTVRIPVAIAAAGAVMLAVVLALGPTSALWVRIAVGALVYVAMLKTFGGAELGTILHTVAPDIGHTLRRAARGMLKRP